MSIELSIGRPLNILFHEQEAENQNEKILELRRNLREAAQEINLLRESGGKIEGSKLTFDTTLSVFGDPPSKNSQRFTGTSNQSVSSTSSVQPHYSSSIVRNKNKPRLDTTAILDDESVNNSVAASRSGSKKGGNSPLSIVPYRNPRGISPGLNTPSRGLAISAPNNWLHLFRLDVQKAIDDGRCRDMSLNECKELIERIYESKIVANEKAMKGVGNLPMETLEQHTYRTLEKKYGLRSLAVDHVGMLIKAVDQYVATGDNDIIVFQKIFRNEIEEDFRLIQEELKTSIKDLTMVSIMGRNPTKDQPTLLLLLDQKMTSGVISEEEWKDLINYLYNPIDSNTLCLLLRKIAVEGIDNGPAISLIVNNFSASTNNYNTSDMASVSGQSLSPSLNHTYITPKGSSKTYTIGNNNTVARNNIDGVATGQIGPPLTQSQKFGYSKGNVKDLKRLGYSSPTLKINVKEPVLKTKKGEILKLPYTLFMKTVLDFQLRSHQEYLRNFVNIFRQIDLDVDGVLNASQFRECYQKLRRLNQQEGSDNTYRDENEEEEEELRVFLNLIKQVDPLESDRIVFSSAVTCLNELQRNRNNNSNNSIGEE